MFMDPESLDDQLQHDGLSEEALRQFERVKRDQGETPART